jgi:hypothetical protein
MAIWLKRFSGIHSMTRSTLFAAVLFLVHGSLYSQVTQIKPINLLSMLQGGSVHRTSVPAATSDSLHPFDGDPYSDQLVNGSDTLVITLQFDSPIEVTASKVFFMSKGRWWLEGASSLADLDARTGSFVQLVGNRAFKYFGWDSLAFPAAEIQFLRLRARDTVYGSYVDLGEWTLQKNVTFTKLTIMPYPPRVIPGGTLSLRVGMQDSTGEFYSYSLSNPIEWEIDDASVATVDPNGKLTGVKPGATLVRVETLPPLLKGSAPVIVDTAFVSQKVSPMRPKVALVLIDPPLQDYGGEAMHVKYNWRDPAVLSNDLVAHFKQATDSVIQFEIATTIIPNRLFTRVRGSFPSVEQFEAWLDQPGWTTLKAMSDSGKIAFDYQELVKYYHFDSLRNAGAIDEVWVYAAPYMGMYESQLMGPTAFWWNSPPIRTGTALKKLLSVMGLNYERGVDQAFHSFGHRMESAMVQAYEVVQGRPWNDTSAHPTPWDLFTRVEKDIPGKSHVGNIHFPPNGTHDYDYGNSKWVTSYAENWFRYPYLMEQSRPVNVSTWIYSPADPLAEGQDHLGYLTWWYNHIPRYTGVTDGVLNNWWMYWMDLDSAMVLAKQTPVLAIGEGSQALPLEFTLEQNYPNPFNPLTVIKYTVAGAGPVSANSGDRDSRSALQADRRGQGLGARNIQLKVYDVLGREVATLVNERKPAGSYTVQFDAARFATGVYFYRLTAGEFVQTRKMILLK